MQKTIQIYDLKQQRLHALERVRQSIDEMTIVESSLDQNSNGRELVKSLLKSLRASEARLAAGLDRRAQR